MPVRSEGHLQRRGAAQRPRRFTPARIAGLVLLFLGLVATVVSLISLSMR